jgi:hypothetical protein
MYVIIPNEFSPRLRGSSAISGTPFISTVAGELDDVLSDVVYVQAFADASANICTTYDEGLPAFNLFSASGCCPRFSCRLAGLPIDPTSRARFLGSTYRFL